MICSAIWFILCIYVYEHEHRITEYKANFSHAVGENAIATLRTRRIFFAFHKFSATCSFPDLYRIHVPAVIMQTIIFTRQFIHFFSVVRSFPFLLRISQRPILDLSKSCITFLLLIRLNYHRQHIEAQMLSFVIHICPFKNQFISWHLNTNVLFQTQCPFRFHY